MTTEFWYLWGRIARQEAAVSREARGRVGTSEDSSRDSIALGDELNAGVVAVCAAAFSLEALVLKLTDEVMPASVAAAWTTGRRPPAFVNRLRETLKHSTELGPAEISDLIDAFAPVVRKRGSAVHNVSTLEPPMPHPVAGNSTRAMVDFGAEAADEAVAAMADIYGALLAPVKPAARRWVDQQRFGISQLAGTN